MKIPKRERASELRGLDAKADDARENWSITTTAIDKVVTQRVVREADSWEEPES